MSGEGSAKENPVSNGNGAKASTPGPASEGVPPTFGKSAVLMLLVSVVLYAYQTNLLDRLFQPLASEESADPAFHFPKPTSSADAAKRDAVVQAFKHAWSGYEKHAMGSDEYHPLSKKGSNFAEGGGIGYAIVDAMDTMQIMGLKDEFARARKWLATEHTFDRDGKFNTFETTIRVLGGLLSAYHLSNNDPIFLEKAIDLADRMLPAFDTPSGLPLPMVNLKTRQGVADEHSPDIISTAEAATLQLELRYLSFLTDNEDYWDKAEGVMKVIKAARLPLRLVPIFMSARTGQFTLSEIRLGSRGDSYYEYLLKQYLQTGKAEPGYLELYNEAMDAIHGKLITKALHLNHTFTSELIPENRGGQTDWRLSPKQDHLVCFLGGNLMLGAVQGGAVASKVSRPPKPEQLSEKARRDWNTGMELIKTCMHTHETKTGLPPEIAHFYTESDKNRRRNLKQDFYISGNDFPGVPSYDARYLLRPETVESLFIAFRLTGDPKYREWGWNIFQSIEKHARVEDGYASLLDVDAPGFAKMDKMETFFLSETLKYLYLLFSDTSKIPLDKYVFNTEAHPLPIFNPSRRTAFSS